MLYLYDTPPETRVSGQGTWQRERSGGGWVVAASGVYSTDPGSTHTLSYVVRERGGELLLCIESDEGSRCFLRDP